MSSNSQGTHSSYVTLTKEDIPRLQVSRIFVKNSNHSVPLVVPALVRLRLIQIHVRILYPYIYIYIHHTICVYVHTPGVRELRI